MEFLPQQNKRNQGDTVPDERTILATGKDVIVIGGGDTGSDCTGTSNRQGCQERHAVRAAARSRPTSATIPRAHERPAGHALALLAGDPAHQHVARGRLRPRLEHPHARSSSGDANGHVREPA